MRAWLTCIGVSTAISLLSFWGVGGLCHWWFYSRRRGQASRWKLQPQRWPTDQQLRHAILLGGSNLVLGSLFGGSFAYWLGHGGRSLLYFDAARFGWLWLPVSGLLALVAIDAGLYYSHRLLHHRRLFALIHRWHHRYTAPTVFTTTAMHPLEFVIFAAFLLLPAFVIPMHVAVYVVVIGYTYLVGMVDHAGIRLGFHLPLHDDGRFHDDHHIHFHCNYGHHTSLFDRLHGTLLGGRNTRAAEP
jgi:lathosterol oxidase